MNAALRGGLAGGVAGLTMGLGAPALSGIFGNGIVAGAINGLVSGAVSDAVNQGYDLVQGTRCEFSFSELGAGAAMGGVFGGGFSAASSALGGMRSAMAARGAGPGNFVQVSESMSVRAVAYQGRITGLPSGTGYVANAVKYDGFANGVLLDAKGPGYANFVKNGQFQSWWNCADSFVQQAQRQLGATGGAPIQWHCSSRAFLGIT